MVGCPSGRPRLRVPVPARAVWLRPWLQLGDPGSGVGSGVRGAFTVADIVQCGLRGRFGVLPGGMRLSWPPGTPQRFLAVTRLSICPTLSTRAGRPTQSIAETRRSASATNMGGMACGSLRHQPCGSQLSDANAPPPTIPLWPVRDAESALRLPGAVPVAWDCGGRGAFLTAACLGRSVDVAGLIAWSSPATWPRPSSWNRARRFAAGSARQCAAVRNWH